MTRKEEIELALSKYIEEHGYHGDYIAEVERDIAFKSGAEWADEHPKSQWISVKDDLPCNHEDMLEDDNHTKKVLVVLAWNEDSTKIHIDISDMCNIIGSYNVNFYWRCNSFYTVTHWKKLPNLPK